MEYTASIPFRGDAEKPLAMALSALTGIGFRLTERTPRSLDFAGPGMNSSRESALVGASRIGIQVGSGDITVDAELGGVQRLARFATWFPIGLCLFLAVVFSVVFGFIFGPDRLVIPVIAVTAGNALLWMFLGPWMARSFRTRTERALDALLANMVMW